MHELQSWTLKAQVFDSQKLMLSISLNAAPSRRSKYDHMAGQAAPGAPQFNKCHPCCKPHASLAHCSAFTLRNSLCKPIPSLQQGLGHLTDNESHMYADFSVLYKTKGCCSFGLICSPRKQDRNMLWIHFCCCQLLKASQELFLVWSPNLRQADV